LYYREGLEDAKIYDELKEEIALERGGESKTPADYIKKRRQRLLDAASKLPGFITDSKKQRRVIWIEYTYQTPTGEGSSRYGELTGNFDKPISSLQPGARKQCKITHGVDLDKFGSSLDRVFESRALAVGFIEQNNMVFIPSEIPSAK
jgi:hypothetical protein